MQCRSSRAWIQPASHHAFSAPFHPKSILGCPQEYIRHLLFTRLSEGTIAVVLKALLKLPWAESEQYVLKCMMKVGGGCGC